MRVKSKLYLNMAISVAGIAVIGGASLVGMKFVQSRIGLLTERSTPYQLKTIELQRGLQEHTSNLLKVGASVSTQELASSRSEAEKSLAEVRRLSGELATLKGGGGSEGDGALSELSAISLEMVGTTEERIKAEEGTRQADALMRGKLREATARLRETDASVKKLQRSSVGRLSNSNASVKTITRNLQSVQLVKDALKDLKLALIEIQTAAAKSAVTIGRNKFISAARSIAASEMIKASTSDASKVIKDGIEELSRKVTGSGGLVEIKSGLLSGQPSDEAKKGLDDSVKFVMQKVSQLTVSMEEEVDRANERFKSENVTFDSSLQGSSAAGDILALNSELTSLGFNIESLIGRLFNARTDGDLNGLAGELSRRFDAAASVSGRIVAELGKAGRKDEVRMIRGVAGSMAGIRGLVMGGDGVIAKLGKVIAVEARSRNLNEKLKALVARQNEEGKRGMTVAQGEQEKTVRAVNQLVRTFVISVTVIGLAILVLGAVFSRLICRSIEKPIHDLSEIAEDFGNGVFCHRLDESRKDEFGELATHFNKAMEKLTEITGGITRIIEKLACSSRELSDTSDELSKGSREQAVQTEQAASAMTEMTQTIADVARNATSAADAVKVALDTAASGKGIVNRTVQGMENIAASVREATGTIGRLGENSEKIGSIITVIEEIADQTNLLALNAAIEAARAGDMGKGFAVVADEVRSLAARTSEATREIGAMVREIQVNTSRSVTSMGSGSKMVEEEVAMAAGARKALEEIVTASESGADMVARIATAAEEQSSVADEVCSGMGSIADITRKTELSTGEISRKAEDLARLADELSRMAEWFKGDERRAA